MRRADIVEQLFPRLYLLKEGGCSNSRVALQWDAVQLGHSFQG
uniref:Uncharacterized protein n=1 Tax=Rhizobium leguminosarum bv. viciae TaxID=387 RepID=A0A0U3JPB1_RHILV|nr:hypothetical protein [Rhizobium leguminosarum bv. viciae]